MSLVNENLLEPDQRTPEWYASRAGKFTGSRFVDLLARGKEGNPTKAYYDLLDQIVVERLYGQYVDNDIDSHSLRWGRDVEPYARQAYTIETGESVRFASFINHPVYQFVGVSPDGLVDSIGDGKGGTEIKCPKDPAIHIARFEQGIGDKFVPQVQGCIWVCETDWWDWISYDPRAPAHMRMYRERIYRDEAYIKNLEKEILRAESKVRERLREFTPERIEEIINQRNKKGITS